MGKQSVNRTFELVEKLNISFNQEVAFPMSITNLKNHGLGFPPFFVSFAYFDEPAESSEFYLQLPTLSVNPVVGPGLVNFITRPYVDSQSVYIDQYQTSNSDTDAWLVANFLFNRRSDG